MIECFYFGCWNEKGHYLHSKGGQSLGRNMPKDFPFPEYVLDSGFLPPNQPEIQGVATHVHINDWTVIAFWDRTVDSRGKSNSAFIMRGEHTFDEAVAIAKTEFPQVWGRFKFQVVNRIGRIPPHATDSPTTYS